MNNFLGKDNYVWWVGVVENNNDPLQLGRCQVRIFGWHSENKQDIPTTELPWAQASFSPNGSNKWSVPNFGEYVTGFFGDGLSAQFPIMTGVMPGIFRSSGGDKGFQDVRTDEQKAAGPQMPAGQVRYTDGQPTTPALARGQIQNTNIAYTNANRAHTCDFVTDLLKNNKLKEFLIAGAQAIRNAIRAVMKALGLSDTSGTLTTLTNQLKEIARTLKFLQKLIQRIVDFEKYVLQYIAEIQKIIQWILSLPAQLQALLAECLYKLIQGIKNVLSDVISQVSTGGGSGFGDLVSAAKDVVSSGQSLAQTTITAIGGAQTVLSSAQSTVQLAGQGLQVPQQLVSVVSSAGTIATAATIGVATSSVSNVGSLLPSANSTASSAQSSSQNKNIP